MRCFGCGGGERRRCGSRGVLAISNEVPPVWWPPMPGGGPHQQWSFRELALEDHLEEFPLTARSDEQLVQVSRPRCVLSPKCPAFWLCGVRRVEIEFTLPHWWVVLGDSSGAFYSWETHLYSCAAQADPQGTLPQASPTTESFSRKQPREAM